MYPCPCCGYLTLSKNPSGTYLMCPICCWEDAMFEREPGSNQVSLRLAQQNFITFGACEQEWLDYVRSPTESDRRDLNWQTLDEIADAASLVLIEQITTAFSEVTREDGVSLHETIAIDDYEGAEGRAAARLKDTDTRWQDVSDQLIEEFSDGWSFFDAKGFRYYIPAYMIWLLKNYETSESNSIITTIYAFQVYKLDKFPDYDPYYRYRLLNGEQSKAIANFLNFLATYCDDWVDTQAAKKALNQYWHQFLTE